MPQLLFGPADAVLDQIADVLARYEADHPDAKTAFYRQNSASVRIRVIDPTFEGLSKAERGRKVWPYLRTLAEDAQADITVLLLLTQDETEKSFGNTDFDNPVLSEL